MFTVIVMASVLGVLVVGFAAFYLYSRTPEWGDSELRMSMVRLLVIIGPLFGMRYREPHRELPVATTPGPERQPLSLLRPGEDEEVGPDRGSDR